MKKSSVYRPHPALFHAHLNTIVPNRLRRIPGLKYQRERITTPDGDFLDLDWLHPLNETGNVVVLLHGLEGSSLSSYMQGMAKALADAGTSVCALNFRGCSGEDNLALQAYHSGKIDDLNTLINYLKEKKYSIKAAIGYSLGGNLLLRYLGDKIGQSAPIEKAIAISAPVHLASSGIQLKKSKNKIYLLHFLRKLKQKARLKQKRFPNAELNWKAIYASRDFHGFDDAFTAPIHGYLSASDYYERASSVHVLAEIKIPTLLINAKDDTFLSPQCFPKEKVVNNPYFTTLYPSKGGHVGFIDNLPLKNLQWHERQVLEFLELN